jgi:hypothetical protein
MDFANQVHGVQGVNLTRAGRAAALVHAANGALLTQDNGAASQGFLVLGMPNENTWNICDGIRDFHGLPPEKSPEMKLGKQSRFTQ